MLLSEQIINKKISSGGMSEWSGSFKISKKEGPVARGSNTLIGSASALMDLDFKIFQILNINCLNIKCPTTLLTIHKSIRIKGVIKDPNYLINQWITLQLLVCTCKLLMFTVPSPSPLIIVGSFEGNGQKAIPTPAVELFFISISFVLLKGKAPGG